MSRLTEIGEVAALWRYPVKSMAAEALDEVEVSWQGLAGDRRWALIQGRDAAQRVSLADHPRAPGDVALPPTVCRPGASPNLLVQASGEPAF